MATTPLFEVEQQNGSEHPPNVEDAADAQLLEDFISQQDGTAFAELVRRHSAMVLGVCKRIVQNPHDAEDCFQATFLVLVRKATSIWPREMVGNWLYGVAYRTALEARKMTARRRAMERKKQEMPSPESVEDLWEELRPVLDQEIHRLPDKYRSVLVLCDLDGKTRTEAAQALDLPEGTVASRLARARTLLTRRLARHSLTMTTAMLARVLAEKAQNAAPTSLIASTASAGIALASGQADSGLIPTEAALLADRVVKILLMTRLKLGVAGLILLAVLGIGIGAFLPASFAERLRNPWHLQAHEPTQKPRAQEWAKAFQVQKVDLENRVILVAKFNFSGETTTTIELKIDPATRILIDGREGELADVRAGFVVRVEFEQNPEGKSRASTIEVIGEKLEGTLLAVRESSVTVQFEEAHGLISDKTYELDQSAKVLIDGKKSKFSDLKTKMKVTLLVSSAKPTVANIDAAGPRVDGEVKLIDLKQHTISVHPNAMNPAAEGIVVTKDAPILIDGKEARLSDLKPGMRVTLQMSAETDHGVVVGITGRQGPKK